LSGRVQERLKDLETVLKFDEALFLLVEQRPAEYERLFRDLGIDLSALSVDEAAAHIRGRFIAVDLAAALDLWVGSNILAARGTPENGDDSFGRKLIAVARQADPDPWRDRARQAFEQNGTAALEELARTAPVDKLLPATLRTIGYMLAGRY